MTEPQPEIMPDQRRRSEASRVAPVSPVVDEAVLAALESDLSSELMPGVVATFLDEIEQRVAAISAATAAGDATTAGQQGHALKGSAATFGAVGLRDVACLIEQAGRSGGLVDVQARLSALRRRADAAATALRIRFL